MATIKEVSQRAGVSASTVSRVLNGTVPVAPETERRVLEAIDALNYRPNAFARGLATNRSGGIGVVVNELSSPYYGAVLKGIELAIEAKGMHMLVSSGHASAKQEREAIEFLGERRSDALVVQVEATSDLDLLELAGRQPPMVIFGRYLAELDGRCVYLDNEAGGELATLHLLEHGHRRIAHIAGPMSFPDSRDRLQGYRRALEAAAIAYDARRVIEGDFTEDGGYRATTRLLKRDLDIDAIFAANDQMAAGALQALRELGRSVPHDISLVGYDDVLLARYLYPALTTIRQPLVEMGRAAAEIALAALANEEAEVRRKFEPSLVIRQSVRERG